jgi:hypothetical protein
LSSKLQIIFISIFFFITVFSGKAQDRFKIDVSIGYSIPKYESYGENVTLSPNQDYILIDDKFLLVSDNFGTQDGYSVNVLAKFSLFKYEYVNGLFDIAYNRLFAVYPGPGDDYGIKIQSFSFGPGVEINPIPKSRISPSVFGLFRINFVGGESFHHAGLHFFKVTPRFGYSAGLKVNYDLNKNFILFVGTSYNYDNLWGKETNEDLTVEGHVIPFRDEASSSNGLSHDRRFVYLSLFLGMTFKIF